MVEAEQILFDGRDLSRASERDMIKIRGKDISMVFQDPMTSLNPLYTIQRQMEEVLILHEPQMNAAQRKARCLELLSAVGIPNPQERLKEYPNQFSGGMRQRAALLRTYLFSGSVALLDEPFSALDMMTKKSVHDWYLKVMDEIHLSTLFITHDIDEAILLSDRIYLLTGRPGRITEELIIEETTPRDRDFGLTAEFLEYKRHILKHLERTVWMRLTGTGKEYYN